MAPCRCPTPIFTHGADDTSTSHHSRHGPGFLLQSLLVILLLLCPPCHPVNNTTRNNITSDDFSATTESPITPTPSPSYTTSFHSSSPKAIPNTNQLFPDLGQGEKVIKEAQEHVLSSLPRNSTRRSSKVIIDTKQGRMGGIAVSQDDQVTTSFLGLPYAAPPLGDLRFKPPEKHSWKQEKGWSFRTIWNATKVKPACPRDPIAWRYPFSLDSLYGDMVSKVETSEDCLYLNIFVPRNLTKLEHINTLGLPVMVHFHDGHIRTEHSMLRNAWRFARDGNIIVATVSFRVGVLGYFSLLQPEAGGNFGLLDQSLAMHWIWDNIREFGGDPEKITIFGSGLGGIDVGYHVISPQSRGMFVRAISQSGSVLSRCCRQRDPKRAGLALAARLKCPSSPVSSTMACLRKVPLGHLMTAAEKLAKQHGHWWPVIDGQFIPDDPLKLLQGGHFNPVDYVMGANSHDGYGIIKDMHIDLDRDVSNDGFEDLVQHFVKQYFSMNLEQVTRALLTEYHFCALNVTQLGESLVNFLTDMEYMAPAELAARYLSRNINRRVFLYEFAHRPTYASSARPAFVGAQHLDDLEYVTGDVRYVISNVTQSERLLSQALMSAWANFARTGPSIDVNSHEERKYIIFESALMSLLSTCPTCSSQLKVNAMTVKGALLTVKRECPSCQYCIKPWRSSPMCGRTACINLVISSSIYTAGASVSKSLRMLRLMNVAAITKRTVNRHARHIIQPTISLEWKAQQKDLLDELKEKLGGLVLAGDGRCDSPGHTAKFGSFTFIEQRIKKVVTVQLVQKNEVKNSAWMEHEGLQRAVQVFREEGMRIDTLITDRHKQNAAWIRKNLPDVSHFYDIWHVAKGLGKKIDAIGKLKDCEDVALWRKSICNHVYFCAASSPDEETVVAKFKAIISHVQNTHVHDDIHYPSCDHAPLAFSERQWLEKGSKASDKLEELLHKKMLLGDIAKLSPVYQTSTLEAKHSLDIQFVPKHTAFSYWGMYTSDPNPIAAGHGLRWDRFTEAERNYVKFTTGLTSANLRTNLRPRQMTLWNDYLRYLGEIPTMCSTARDHCERGMRPITEYHNKVSSAMWFLIVLVLVLIGAVVFLAAKIWVPPETWEKCKIRRPAKGSHEAETKKLHPLPYCDEPT